MMRPPQIHPTSQPFHHDRACPQPAEVITGRLVRGIQELLVRWEGQSAADTTWVSLEDFKKLFPSFQLEDELIVQGGRDVITGIQYLRRPRKSTTAQQ